MNDSSKKGLFITVEGVDGAGGVGGTIRPRLAQQVAALIENARTDL